ncbi:MAG: MarR family transcriptional regulator [Oscillospiraceae bacterium]|nr:MarR family transcriptional regulator [Oscillospiraceae bacterium]
MKPEISTKELSYLLDIRQQSLNELLNKLEKQDFVTRTQSETDKRVLMVNLTEKGKNVQSQDVGYSDIFNCLNEEEKEAFSEYLTRVISALEIELNYEPNTEYEFEPDDHGSKEHPLPHGPHPHGPHPPKPPKPHPHDPYINFYEPEDE